MEINEVLFLVQTISCYVFESNFWWKEVPEVSAATQQLRKRCLRVARWTQVIVGGK